MLTKNTFLLLGIFLTFALLASSKYGSEKPKVWSNIPITQYETNLTQIAGLKVNDMHMGKKYNYYQTDNRIFMMKNNSIANLYEISIPDIIFAQTACSKLAFHASELYSVSACRDLSDNVTYLVMVSHLSSRPFYFHSLKTDLHADVSMSFVGDLLIVVERADERVNYTKGHIFRVNLGSSVGSSQPMQFISSTEIPQWKLKSWEGRIERRKCPMLFWSQCFDNKIMKA